MAIARRRIRLWIFGGLALASLVALSVEGVAEYRFRQQASQSLAAQLHVTINGKTAHAQNAVFQGHDGLSAVEIALPKHVSGSAATWNIHGSAGHLSSDVNTSDGTLMLWLPPGRHPLVLRSEAQPEQRVYIHISQKWYARPWFLMLCLTLVSGAASWVAWEFRREQLDARRRQETIEFLRQQAVQAQMNPHFIFNVLSTVQHAILREDKMTANRHLVRLSKLIRNFLDASVKAGLSDQQDAAREISLRQELELLGDYMEFERIQKNNSFEFRMQVDDDINIDGVSVPPMLIQPFLENAVKHGVAFLEEGGLVELIIRQQDSALEVLVRDNGIGREEAAKHREHSLRTHKSHGGDLVRERIRLLNRMGYQIDFEQKDLEPGLEVRLFLHE